MLLLHFLLLLMLLVTENWSDQLMERVIRLDCKCAVLVSVSVHAVEIA